ncbi:mitogen-activated protein kinase kinase kinase 4 isoform X2 [Spodoptera litura]|uniref:Mitogen-activated protein kinase kinase kinase 4 isoform X2 n=1 Tax=Spodoptera litura TaxID=69820 RepID=A0A9J7ECF2_SPOLT|nr:mitogen-activated protein kinase kinase kinase 4 isoform X2 [Spodoptera litura]
MDSTTDKDWKKNLGFPINYNSASSDDEFDIKDVVFRNPRHSSKYLLADSGDGSEADLLGTTPPRSRIRDKERGRKNHLDATPGFQRLLRERKDVVDYPTYDQTSPMPDRPKKRSSLKLLRSRARDSKQDMSHDVRADSLPSPNPMPAVPTLLHAQVESCSRFMSLTSRPKHREVAGPEPSLPADTEDRWRCDGDEDLPPSRVNFHKTFSLLINMGNIEKGCKRAVSNISREEQVWQNELKDLIWLELQAKISGRTLAQQDAYLCAQRNVVPKIINNILEYRFINKNPCRANSKRALDTIKSHEDLTAEENYEEPSEEEAQLGCLSFSCEGCAGAVGRAMREVAGLLDSFYGAVALYPSSRNMTTEHPLVATPLFQNRVKAMCLWYNTALHMRLKLVAMRRMLRSIRLKSQRRQAQQRTSVDSSISRQSSESRPCQVRFNVCSPSPHPSDSSSSDASEHGADAAPADADKAGDELDSAEDCKIELPDCNGLGTPDVAGPYRWGDPQASNESGYMSSEGPPVANDAFEIGGLAELTQMRLLDKCKVSLYRDYHQEILKTQGVRRCMMFIYKMRMNLLDKVYLTLEKPDSAQSDSFIDDDTEEVFEEPNTERPDAAHDEDEMKTYELRRYGCWSPECASMRLPWYRAHFLLLSCMCMEAVHDYLAFRLEARPDHPSCLTVKQLIHEIREGLDIASEMRADFALHVQAALGGRAPGRAADDLILLTNTFDTTVETLLKQYLSYLSTVSVTEHMPRSRLQAEWAFTAQLAKRIKCAAVLAPEAFSEITCNQLDRLLKQFKEESINSIKNKSKDITDLDNSRHAIYEVCRSAQRMYASSRDATLQAAQWARALAARLARAPPPAYLLQRGHIFNSIMAIRDFITSHIEFVLDKSRMAASEDLPRDLTETVVVRVRELLLQMYKLGFEMHKELHRLVSEVPRPVAPVPRRPAPPPPTRRSRFMRSDSIVDEYENSVFDERLFDNIHNFGENQWQGSIEALLRGAGGAGPAPEPLAAGPTGEERAWAARVARAIIHFARCWMHFVVERCDRGRGLRPRWASQGLEFLMLACDPRNTKHLSEEEFEELKSLMDGCISHVIGSRPAPHPPTHSPRPRPRLASPFPSNSTSSSTSKEAATPPTPPPMEPDLHSYPEAESKSHRRRVLAATERVDAARDARLRANKSVGHVLGAALTSYEPKLRQLTFKWQRGLKIGAGTFGKVYTVVNTESGQLLAMKELSVGAGDRRALQRAANELRVLEGVLHPHLVRYYGCELHREEMLLFMELCVEGSLEALVATSGALAEPTVRRYTKQLLAAVRELHARNIAHRDIKSGNIFLTNEGHCLKLGDFGCAVKIRANTTAPGELQGFVGTQAYMAPEVFMKSSGHGRAADIWSLGCVVTEMASGKRPFSQYDSNYQIMFLVGSGGRPEIPDTLSDEGQEFCLSCLTHDPDLRPRAETLTLHHFLMVKSDENECNCEPGFLMT